MSRPALTSITLLGILAGAAFFWLDSANDGPRPPGGTDAAQQDTAGVAVVAAQAASRAAVSPARGDVAPYEGSVRDGILIEVLDKGTGEPVPGAEVFYLDQSTLPLGLQATSPKPLDEILVLSREYGRHFRTGVDGTTCVPRGDASATVYAEAAALRGCNVLGNVVGDRLRVLLASPSSISVQVVDPSGNPHPGVCVAVVSRETGEPWRVVAQGNVEGPDARVTFDLVEGFFPQTPDLIEVAVVLLIPVKELVLREIDSVSPPDDPIVLRMPPTGALEVQALGLHGQRVLDSAFAQLTLTDLPPESLGLRFGPKRMDTGIATFPHVGLGLNLTATVRRMNTQRDTKGSGPGPVGPGERAVLVVREMADVSVLTVRVLDEQGLVLAHTELRSSQEYSSGWSSPSLHLVTDADGIVRIPVVERPVPGRILSLWRALPGRRYDTTACARLDIARDFSLGETHLGDVRLESAPLLIRGRVLDSRGLAVPEAIVEVEERVPRLDTATGLRRRHMVESAAMSASDGTFEIRGWAEGPVLSVHTRKNGYAPSKPMERSTGTVDLQLVIHRAGRVVASLSESSLPVAARVRAVLLSQSEGTSSVRSGTSMTWDDLVPGAYDLGLRLHGHREFLLTISGIRVVAGEVTRDIRAEGIDLSRLLRRVVVSVLDAKGDPVRNGTVRQSIGDSWTRVPTDANGLAVLATPRSGTDLVVSASGYRSESRNRVISNQVFMLRPGLPVRVEVRGLSETLGEDVMIEVQLYTDTDVRGIRLHGGSLITLPSAGTYRIRWWPHVSFGSSSRRRMLPQIAGATETIDVADTDELQFLEITFPPARKAELRQMIQDLREGR